MSAARTPGRICFCVLEASIVIARRAFWAERFFATGTPMPCREALGNGVVAAVKSGLV